MPELNRTNDPLDLTDAPILICETRHRPFLGGRETIALYQTKLIIAIVRGKGDLPESLLRTDGASNWIEFGRAKKVRIVAVDEIESVNTYEKQDWISFAIIANDEKIVFDVAHDAGEVILQEFAQRMPNKLVSRLHTGRDARRAHYWGVVVGCVGVDILAAWVVYEMYRGTFQGRGVVANIIYQIYESRGFAVAAVLTAFGAMAINMLFALMLVIVPSNPESILNCNECGYDIRGLRGERCPECGLLLNREFETPKKP